MCENLKMERVVEPSHPVESGIHTCIYCLRQLPVDQFDREHVLSQAFGSYEQAPVLHRCVCKECNRYFGNTLELGFARGAFEGLLRYRLGVKTPDLGPIDLRYVEFAIPPGSDWSGVRLRLVQDESGPKLKILPQAAFLDPLAGEWTHFTSNEMRPGFLSDRPDLKKAPLRIYAGSYEENETVIAKLRLEGIDFRKEGDLKLPESLVNALDIEVEVSFTVNQGIRRCIAKYAFNYMTSICGTAFALGSDFNLVRRFIRFDEIPPYPLVATSFSPILYDDSPLRRQTNGHLLTVEWAGEDLVAQVSLFNYLTYSVLLSRGFGGALWRPVRAGLYFDINRRVVRPLAPASRMLMP